MLLEISLTCLSLSYECPQCPPSNVLLCPYTIAFQMHLVAKLPHYMSLTSSCSLLCPADPTMFSPKYSYLSRSVPFPVPPGGSGQGVAGDTRGHAGTRAAGGARGVVLLAVRAAALKGARSGRGRRGTSGGTGGRAALALLRLHPPTAPSQPLPAPGRGSQAGRATLPAARA